MAEDREQDGGAEERLTVMFPMAGQPEIVRSYQKDEFHAKWLFEKIYDAFAIYLGPRLAIAWQREVRLFSDLFCFATSTFVRRQTLGEEYCDLIQLSSASDQFLPLSKRLQLGCWTIVLPYFYSRLMNRIVSIGTNDTSDGWAALIFARISPHVPLIKIAIQRFQRLHLAMFYLGGHYYEWAKRMAGVGFSLYHTTYI